ncbi:serine hydrolase [Geothrix oryzisoli]|uniref:serine hydrolase n=1 Tax=Geothrix oryzisoli TaxID=2922721 RepID=UPI001FAC4484|nr:serine hydrolase [Geothrix oryzisoli]
MKIGLRASSLGLLALAPVCLSAQPPSAQAAPAKPRLQPRLWTRMSEDITKIADEVDGRVGVFIRSLETGDTFSLHGEEVFPAASTIKLALLLELYRRPEEGQERVPRARLSDEYLLQPRDLAEDSAILGNLTPGTRLTNRDLALFTVVVSDNSATNILIDRLGMARVNATLERLGLKNTHLRRKMMDLQAAREGRENLTTPRELADLLGAIQRGPDLAPEARADLMRLLRTPKDGFLTRLLPEALPVANKPGVLPGVRNDVGLVLLKDRPFLIAVMTSHLRDERQGEAAIARIALRAAACFEMDAATSPEGRVLGPLLVH